MGSLFVENEILQLLDNQKAFFKSYKSYSYKDRLKKLIKLKNAIEKNEGLITDALKEDLNKAPYESYMAETGIIIHEITKAINKDTNYVLAYNNRGGLYIDLNNLDNALNDIDKAISIDNDYAPAYNNKGVILHIQKKYAEALFYFDKAILLDNNYAKAYLNRGITRQMKRDEYGACNDWIKAKKLGINLANKYLDNDCN